ncbi:MULTISPECIES: plasmid mobilization protein [Xanthomonas]|uniref:plasmid mobilization protein n=1 Tax=Xanthomonas TaxID=338 RepID=UPI00115CB316|nr:mobilization protein MobB [Xanthomonas perforans]MBZ2574377.1 mobilization protein MobB [Xanthomonas perforans]MBZ3027355.1 mobilization protein MobB [Xanthomonas perforans]MBZ3036019.1 mobilization protein MobB [Xanthomonas perforans]MBZ3048171.1 mobilization protein MobB [Xanthomonas perforans]TQS95041.1 mobilization protein MobB [Xanthomonas perforans]
MTFKPGADNRTVQRRIRLTSEEDERIRELAKLAGKDVSKYMRERALGWKFKSQVDAQMVNELRRLGGLLKKVHTDSHGAFSEDTAEALRAIVGAIKRIGA